MWIFKHQPHKLKCSNCSSKRLLWPEIGLDDIFYRKEQIQKTYAMALRSLLRCSSHLTWHTNPHICLFIIYLHHFHFAENTKQASLLLTQFESARLPNFSIARVCIEKVCASWFLSNIGPSASKMESALQYGLAWTWPQFWHSCFLEN